MQPWRLSIRLAHSSTCHQAPNDHAWALQLRASWQQCGCVWTLGAAPRRCACASCDCACSWRCDICSGMWRDRLRGGRRRWGSLGQGRLLRPLHVCRGSGVTGVPPWLLLLILLLRLILLLLALPVCQCRLNI